MNAFEAWAVTEGCTLVAAGDARAAPFYRALDYEESAAASAKVLAGPRRENRGTLPH